MGEEKKPRRWRWILAALAVAAMGGAGVFGLVLYKDRTYVPSEPYAPPAGAADTLVVYYSRSGNTEAMAREIARHQRAHIHHIGSDVYTLDFAGWRNAANDARKGRDTPIKSGELDLRQYRLIFLGAPVWLFRPAPPLWTFVEQSDLSGKKVVLFNTFNSRFKEDEFAKFRRRVEARGGQVIDHIYVRRGRVLMQKSRAELLDEVKALLRERSPAWRSDG